MSDFLIQAKTAADILRELGRSVWALTHNGEECPSEHIPTEQDLLDYADAIDASAMDAANERLTAVQQAAVRRAQRPDLAQEQWHWRLGTTWDIARDAKASYHLMAAPVAPLPYPFGYAPIEWVHEHWANMKAAPKHPLAPLVAAWQERPAKVKPRGGTKGLIGAPFVHVRPSEATPPPAASEERLPRAANFSELGDVQPTFPSLIPQTGSERAPALLDALRKAGRAAGRGHVGYLPVIALEGMLDLRTEHRDNKIKLNRHTNRKILTEWLGMDASQYRRTNKAGKAYRRALLSLNSIVIDLPNGGWFRPIMTAAQHGPGLDDEVEFALRMPTAAAVGPAIDRELLRRLRQSAPAWYMFIVLAVHWDRHGGVHGELIKPKLPDVLRNEQGHLVDAKGKVILDKRGKPTSNWNHPRAVKLTDKEGYATRRVWNGKALEKYPTLGSDDLVRFAYGYVPKDANQRRQYVNRAIAALERIERYGYDASERAAGDGLPNGCLIKREGDGWRVMPPDALGQAVERRKAREQGRKPRLADAVDADFEMLD